MTLAKLSFFYSAPTQKNHFFLLINRNRFEKNSEKSGKDQKKDKLIKLKWKKNIISIANTLYRPQVSVIIVYIWVESK